MTVKPWTFFAVAIAGWMNRQQQQVIDYLRTENQILREKLGAKRLILNESQKCRLATAAMKLGKDLLRKWGTLFSPDTLLRWHRWFVARKYDGSDRRGKRGPVPKKANSVRDLVLQMAADNANWGYGHIHGKLKGLGYDVSWQTVRRIMLDHGLLPEPGALHLTRRQDLLDLELPEPNLGLYDPAGPGNIAANPDPAPGSAEAKPGESHESDEGCPDDAPMNSASTWAI